MFPLTGYDAWKLASPPDNGEEQLVDYVVVVTISATLRALSADQEGLHEDITRIQRALERDLPETMSVFGQAEIDMVDIAVMDIV